MSTGPSHFLDISWISVSQFGTQNKRKSKLRKLRDYFLSKGYGNYSTLALLK